MLTLLTDGLRERPRIREEILNSRERLNVVVTTYSMARAKEDNRFLRKLRPCVR